MKAMRLTTSTGRVLPALLATVAVSIVLGILAMHALNTHGVMGSTDHSTMTSPMVGSHANLPAAPAVDDTAGVTTTVPSTVLDTGNGHDMGDMVMLCVAVLAAAGALLLLLLSLRRAPRIWASLPTPAISTGWVTVRLGAGPPPAWAFSVIRC